MASACVSSGDEATIAVVDSNVEISQAQVVAASDFIVEKWGGEEGFAIVVLAIDRGYTVDQLLRDFERLSEDGSLVGLEPRLAPLDLTSAAPGTDAAAGDEEGSLEGGIRLIALAQELDVASSIYVAFLDQTLGEVFDAGLDSLDATTSADETEDALADQPEEVELVLDESAIAAVTLGLLATGYTIEQAIQSLIFGTFRAAGNPRCWWIEDRDERPPGRNLLEDECPSSSERLAEDENEDQPIDPPSEAANDGTTTTAPAPEPPRRS